LPKQHVGEDFITAPSTQQLQCMGCVVKDCGQIDHVLLHVLVLLRFWQSPTVAISCAISCATASFATASFVTASLALGGVVTSAARSGIDPILVDEVQFHQPASTNISTIGISTIGITSRYVDQDAHIAPTE
jgi:hypothetical protein